jgi:hypothetical protein
MKKILALGFATMVALMGIGCEKKVATPASPADSGISSDVMPPSGTP